MNEEIRRAESQVYLDTVLENLEKNRGVRIGLSATNNQNGTSLEYNSSHRFPMCSTVKVIIVAAILKKSMKDTKLLQKKVKFSAADLTGGYEPIVKEYLKNYSDDGEGITVFGLCRAAILSDNTATNLLLKELGGVETVNEFARSIGDNIFRLDRKEPDLNTAIPGDLRDTSTPAAMNKILRKVVLDDVLGAEQQELLQRWLKGNNTGKNQIQGSVPDWVVGDKTGRGSYGTINDIAIIWPPAHSPISVAIYVTKNEESASHDLNIIKEIAKELIVAFSLTDKHLKEIIQIQKDSYNARFFANTAKIKDSHSTIVADAKLQHMSTSRLLSKL